MSDEIPATSETPKRRGRPVSQRVLDRDKAVYDAIAGSARAVTKYEIAEGTGIEVKRVYMSLYRMRHTVHVSKITAKQHYWSVRPAASSAE